MKALIAILILSIFLLGCTQPQSSGSGTSVSAPQPNATGSGGSSGTGSPGAASTATVKISGFAFLPAEITVKQGDTVAWANEDDAPHIVAGSFFESPSLRKGESYTHIFTEAPGEYAYTCKIHPSMSGKVIVK